MEIKFKKGVYEYILLGRVKKKAKLAIGVFGKSRSWGL